MEPLATPKQVGEHLGVTERTLEYWRAHGTGPRFIRYGRKVRYDWNDIHAWLDEHSSAPAGGRS